MEKINRGVQLELLRKLAEAYPRSVNGDPLKQIAGDALTPNMVYLHEHGLVQATRSREIGGPQPVISASITARGIDFLQDDGGLSAILGVVTVRFDEATLKALIAAKIDASDAPTETKGALKKHVADLSANSVKHLVERLLDVGLSRLPDAWQTIEGALNHLAQ